MADFQINKRLSGLDDVVRTYMWDVSISLPPGVAPDGLSSPNDLIIRARTLTLPGRSNETITSHFMGMKQYFAGKVDFTPTFTITFEEFTDRKISKTLYNWQQKIFDSRITGAALASGKTQYTTTILAQLYKMDGTLIKTPDNGTIAFRNAWLQNIAELTLDYNANDSIKYSATFQYDTWDYNN